MSVPEVSVVIPVHNGERFICDAVESALTQSGPRIEVIVVDNNSQDRTREVVAQRYGSAVVLLLELRAGAAHARNAGCAIAKGRYLAFLDADDLWLPGKLEKQLRMLKEPPGADVSFSLGEEFVCPQLEASQSERCVCRPGPYPMKLPSSLLCEREAFLRVGLFPDVPGGEFIAWYAWAQECGLRASVVEEVLVRRRIHNGNSTRNQHTTAGYLAAMKWLLDRRRARAASGSSSA